MALAGAAVTPDVNVLHGPSSANPGKVVVGLSVNQNTWDRFIGAASVIAVAGGLIYAKRRLSKWAEARRERRSTAGEESPGRCILPRKA